MKNPTNQRMERAVLHEAQVKSVRLRLNLNVKMFVGPILDHAVTVKKERNVFHQLPK